MVTRQMQYLCVSFLVLFLSACVPPMVNHRGHTDAASKRFKEIKEGITTRDEVQASFGTPSLTNNFGDETWYYVQQRKESIAFLDPEVADQHITRIIFDNNSVVKKMERYTIKDAQEIQFSEDTTPTEGQELGFVEQILGNVGRFNAGDRGLGARSPGASGGPAGGW